MNANLQETVPGEAVSEARPARIFVRGGDGEPLPPVIQAKSTAEKFTFANPRSFDPVDWDGQESTLPKENPKAMATLRAQYIHSAFVEHRFKTPTEYHEFLRRKTIVGHAVFAAEQGLPTLEVGKLIVDQERHFGREAMRNASANKLEAFIESGEVTSATIKVTTTDPFIVGALHDKHGGVNILPGLLQVARERLAFYGLLYYGLWPALNPDERAGEIKVELSNPVALSPERIEALRDELVKLESSGAELIETAARARLNAAFKPVREVCDHLLIELLTILEAQKADAVAAEKNFFEKHGQPYAVTSVSKRFDPVIASVRHQIDAPKRAQEQHHLSNFIVNPAQTPAIAMFGLEVPGINA